MIKELNKEYEKMLKELSKKYNEMEYIIPIKCDFYDELKSNFIEFEFIEEETQDKLINYLEKFYQDCNSDISISYIVDIIIRIIENEIATVEEIINDKINLNQYL